ncbi:MAG: hypothetical protein GXY20_08740 [Clostridiales bacterium]|nr:hypothetical protein [Clostridiales bacterium]
MLKKALALTAVTILAGAAGAFIRVKELATVFDDQGLAQRFAPVTTALIVLCAAFGVFLFIVCFSGLRGMTCANGYENAFRARSPAVVIISFILAAGMCAGAYMCYRSEVPVLSHAIAVGVLALFAGVSGIAYLCLSIEARRGKGSQTALCSLVIVVFTCYYLIISYKKKAADPVLLDYVYDFLALCSSAMASYYVAGFAFRRGAPRRTVFAGLLSVFFCIVALPGKTDTLYEAFFLIFIAVHLLISVFLLLKNASFPGSANSAHPAAPKTPESPSSKEAAPTPQNLLTPDSPLTPENEIARESESSPGSDDAPDI